MRIRDASIYRRFPFCRGLLRHGLLCGQLLLRGFPSRGLFGRGFPGSHFPGKPSVSAAACDCPVPAAERCRVLQWEVCLGEAEARQALEEWDVGEIFQP